MAEAFYEPLPNLGDAPWSLNGAVQEIRERISDTDDVIETGRLSPNGLSEEIALAAGELNPEALSDTFIAANINATGSNTRTALDAVTRAQIAGRTGITVNVADYPDLKGAINALPSEGGTVFVPFGRFDVGNWTQTTDYMAKQNVRIIGAKRPNLSANSDRLEGGSVLMGRFNVFASGFEVGNVGFDFGKYVCDTYYGGATQGSANHPLGGSWDAFAFAEPNQGAPTPQRNVRIGNIIGLLRGPGAYGHAVLMEGINSGSIENAVGVGGIHGCVVKSRNMRIGALAGYGASNNHVIIKSDTYGVAGNLQIGSVSSARTHPGVNAHWTPVNAEHGLLFNPEGSDFLGGVQVGAVNVSGANSLMAANGQSGRNLPDVQIDSVITEGSAGGSTYGFRSQLITIDRFHVSSFISNNVANGVSMDKGGITFGSIELTNVSDIGIIAFGTTRLKADTIAMVNVDKAYHIEDSARISVGHETLNQVPTKWNRSAPTLGTGWSNLGGVNEPFTVALSNYGVELRGLVVAGTGAKGRVVNLPAYLRPFASRRFPGYLNKPGDIREYALLGVANDGVVELNDGRDADIATGSYTSLDGALFQHS